MQYLQLSNYKGITWYIVIASFVIVLKVFFFHFYHAQILKEYNRQVIDKLILNFIRQKSFSMCMNHSSRNWYVNVNLWTVETGKARIYTNIHLE